MKRILNRTALLPFVLLTTLVFAGGCLNESPTGPGEPSGEDAPVLPAPENMTFQLGFFDQGSSLQRAAGKDNFFNAYLRVVIVQTVLDLTLTPPIGAFALALDTPPSPQPDGSWIWVYTYVNGAEEAQIRLRGVPLAGDRVAWELRLSNNASVPALDDIVWFEGETGQDGDTGYFEFHDVWETGNPIEARIDWGADSNGDFLRFTDLDRNVNDALEYREVGTRMQLTFTDASDTSQDWFVKWDESDGTGSLMAPDYNGGQEACWDQHQNDTSCAPAL